MNCKVMGILEQNEFTVNKSDFFFTIVTHTLQCTSSINYCDRMCFCPQMNHAAFPSKDRVSVSCGNFDIMHFSLIASAQTVLWEK